ncbi:MAG: hypothetical protein MAG431_02414 [Chloroflexi bacterium]|nr:hypothetical protein [Chloroflexota bacterium]
MRNKKPNPVRESEHIIKRLGRCLPEILKNHPVVSAYIYGSVAAGSMTSLSDVDIALVLDKNCKLDAYQRLMVELDIAADIEQYCVILDTDVRIINDAPVRVQGEVVTRGKLLYTRDEDARVEYEVYTRRRYFDFQPVLKMMRESYFAHLENEIREKTPHG